MMTYNIATVIKQFHEWDRKSFSITVLCISLSIRDHALMWFMHIAAQKLQRNYFTTRVIWIMYKHGWNVLSVWIRLVVVWRDDNEKFLPCRWVWISHAKPITFVCVPHHLKQTYWTYHLCMCISTNTTHKWRENFSR